MATVSTAVLVVGGGLVGLSLAMFLAGRGVPTLLVERRARSSRHPRAIGFTTRTLELFRSVGFGPEIPQVPRSVLMSGARPRRAQVESLAGKWHEEPPWTPGPAPASTIEYSPCTGTSMAQDRLEPILRAKAIALSADLRLETELTGFEQSADGVEATLRGRDSGEYTVRADYLVAADGHASFVRGACGIGRGGRGHIRTIRSVLFRAPLEQYLEAGVRQFDIAQPDFKAFLTTYGDGRWVLMLSDDEERDDDTLRAMVVKAIGRDDLDIENITTGRWELSALIAEKFSSGRVFLAGDAAHTLPPARGGYGANTGIEDAHNLAWKLAAVISGMSSPQLLETYDAERRPIAWLRHAQIFARPDYKAVANPSDAAVPIIDDDAMELGQLYRSAAVIGAADDLPAARRPDQWTGQPGTRAPHLWLEDQRVSTLDLLHGGWVLLAEDERWEKATREAGGATGIGLTYIRIGGNLLPSDPGAFRAAFGLGATGASLIRPDGYIAWRARELPAEPQATLTEALGRVSAARRV